MKLRRPDFNFSKTPSRWAHTPEFAQSFNASSLWIPHLERFLNRVMAKAGSKLDPADPRTARIKDDIKMFIRQESMHYTNHAEFNRILTRDGYDVEHFERKFVEEFERLFATKSLAFLCAYCEGFETLGPPAALAWLGGMEDVLNGADPEVVRLWKWHLTEEFEHRAVCHDVFHAVSGNYFIRIYGLIYQFFQLGGFSAKVLAYLNEKDRESMTPTEREESRKRSRATSRKMMKVFIPAILRAMLPFYSPRKAKIPAQYQQMLTEFDAWAA